jgi:predicted enzyme related to lactoylglutathione lyase
LKDVTVIIYPAADLAAAKRFFRELTGTDPYADMPGYVGYKCGDMEIGLVPNRPNSEAGALAYWNVSDIVQSMSALVAAGGTVVQEVTDVGYGMLVATVKDPNGATVGLRQSPKG